MAKFNATKLENVAVYIGSEYSDTVSLRCTYEGAHYHIWVNRKTHEPVEMMLYKNPVADHGKPGYFNTRTLRQDSQFGKFITGEMRSTAVAFRLFEQAEAEQAAKEQAAKEQRAQAIAQRKVGEAGPELLKAAQGALLLLQNIQRVERDRTGEHDQLPYPEIVELENAINLALEGREDANGQ